MDRKIIWANAAIEDLEAAADFISKDSPAYASAFVFRALEMARSLSNMSRRGRIVPEFNDEAIREIFIYSYRLIYRIEDTRISILALIHGRRDFQTAWDERDR